MRKDTKMLCVLRSTAVQIFRSVAALPASFAIFLDIGLFAATFLLPTFFAVTFFAAAFGVEPTLFAANLLAAATDAPFWEATSTLSRQVNAACGVRQVGKVTHVRD
ncbi:hypothetical protein F6X40_39010 [Paraburkholderia sp. UCT31]|uniref:hypothetical protein n=1 Tax=Paraburkholderia sp. UCT31 TaxID=2615209 RepID=UPI001655AAD7|nr:hypothetical protein [Paraburkholderia sp. UCT31]MBC8742497.1 hypothetical protein [Paraburkholderia sp. UCT31]